VIPREGVESFNFCMVFENLHYPVIPREGVERPEEGPFHSDGEVSPGDPVIPREGVERH